MLESLVPSFSAISTLLARPGLALDSATPAAAPTPPSGGDAAPAGTPSASAANGAARNAAADAKKYDIHVQFDKDSAKGAILCKGGKEEGGGIEYDKCSKDKLDNYGEVAVSKGVVPSKEAYGKLPPEAQDSAKKVAFYDSAREEVKSRMSEVLKSKAEDSIEYKKYKGMLRRINKEYRHALNKCQKYADSLKCPAPPAATEPGASDSAKAGDAAHDGAAHDKAAHDGTAPEKSR